MFLQTMQEALRARQANMDHVNSTYREMDAESRQAGYNMAEDIQQNVKSLNSDWTKIQQMATNLRPASSGSIEGAPFVTEGNVIFLSLRNCLCGK